MKAPRGFYGPSCFFVYSTMLCAGLQPFQGLELAYCANSLYALNFLSLFSAIVCSFLDLSLLFVNI